MEDFVNNRLGKFFNEKEFEYTSRMALEYLGDPNQKIYLYAVNTTESNIDDIYHESNSNELILNDPIELSAVVELLEPKNQSYNDNNTLRILEYGNALVHLLVYELKLKNLQIKYGDFLVYMVDDGINPQSPLLFEIVNDGARNIENVRSLMGYAAYFRTLVCTPVDKNKLNFEF